MPIFKIGSDLVNERKIMKSKYLKVKIESIVTQYKIAKIRLVYPNELKEEKRKEYEEFTHRFDACLTALGKEKEELFRLSYMRDEFEWWNLNYSLSQCYRLRRTCGLEFLKLFKNC